MSGQILLALDGSAKDARGIAVAAAFSEVAAAPVHVVRVVPAPEDLPATVGVLAVLDAAHVPRTEIEAELRAAARQIGALRDDIDVSTSEVLEGSDVAEAVLRASRVVEARALVLATRGAGMIGRPVHGSVADEVVRTSVRPVLLVPPRADYMSGKRVRIRRVLVPLDGSRAALHVIERLVEFPNIGHLEIVLLQVVPRERTGGYLMPPSTGNAGAAENDAWTHAGARHAEDRLRRIVEQLGTRGASAEVSVVESADPASVIVTAIREELVDLIAMTTRGAGGVRRMLHGSVATRVARESEVPVLLVTPNVT
jgi:nucleotide-binding universal stress UspA family protein